jgi:hypothetical protein
VAAPVSRTYPLTGFGHSGTPVTGGPVRASLSVATGDGQSDRRREEEGIPRVRGRSGLARCPDQLLGRHRLTHRRWSLRHSGAAWRLPDVPSFKAYVTGKPGHLH